MANIKGDFGRGVVIFRHRPMRDNSGVGDKVVMNIIRHEHTALVIPRFQTPKGVVELGVWSMWAPSEHDEHERSMTAPSIYPCGMQRMSFNHINVCDKETMQTFDVCALLSLQTLVDMQTASMEVAVSSQDASLIDVAYVIAFEVAIDYFEKEGDRASKINSVVAPQMLQLGPAIEEHRRLVQASNVDVKSIVEFRLETQKLAQTLCRTALGLGDIQPVEDCLRLMAMAGMACLARVYCSNSNSMFYAGQMLCSPEEQQMRVLTSYASVAEGLRSDHKRDSLVQSLLSILLNGTFGIVKSLDLHAIVLKPGMKCVKCGSRLLHGEITTGQCYMCPISNGILCTQCTAQGCEVCSNAARTVDFERVAIDTVVRYVTLMRKNSRIEVMLDEQVRRNVAQSRDARMPKFEEMRHQLDDKTREAACLQEDLAAVRLESKKREKRLKRSDAKETGLREELRIAHVELDKLRETNANEKEAERAERAQSRSEVLSLEKIFGASLRGAEAALHKEIDALRVELADERAKCRAKDRMVKDLIERLAQKQPLSDAD